MMRTPILAATGCGLLAVVFSVSSDDTPQAAGSRSIAAERQSTIRDPHRFTVKREFRTDIAQRLQSAATGEWLDLGFELGTMNRGKVNLIHEHEDGRRSISILLPNGDDLFLTMSGDEWDGHVVPQGSASGWKLAGGPEHAVVERLERPDLICAMDGEVAGLPPYHGPVVEQAPTFEIAEAQPIFSSRPGATAVIYLDFDGETVSGTSWNTSFNGGNSIVAGSPNFSNSQIEQAWRGVAEDYRPFQVNVTTDRTAYEAAPSNRRTMVIFTPDNEWYGTAGGVAYVDVFGSISDPPAWVFTDQLANSAAHSSEAASHEAGHTLGLHHDGSSTVGYYGDPPLGSGATTWAPIMGVGYYAAVTQWSKGEYPDANNSEDDLAIISSSRNGFGYRADDHANTPSGATPFTEVSTEGLESAGVIERSTDADVFSFQTSGGTVQFAASNATVDPNLDIRLQLLNAGGGVVAEANASGNLDSSLTAVVPSGTYHLSVSGSGNGELSNGYSDYGSLGEYTIVGSAPRNLVLAAEIISPAAAEASLPFGTGLRLDGVATGGSPSWQVVTAPQGAVVSLSNPAGSSTEAIFPQTGVYQIEFRSSNGESFESDVLTLSVDSGAPMYSNRVPGIDLGEDRDILADRIVLSPTVTDDTPASLTYSWRVVSGPGQLSATTVLTPELVFVSADSPVRLRLEAGDGANLGFREVVLTARYEQTVFIAASAPASAWVATGSPAQNWADPAFDDSSWQVGSLGAGYDVTPGGGPKSPPRRIYLPEIGGIDVETGMSGTTTSCYVRIPFEVGNPSGVLSLLLRMKFDDGFVAYLNGTEVARSNAGTGTPAWNATAPLDRPDEDALSALTFTPEVPANVLVAGTNILAIHGLNHATGSQDRRFLLSAELEGIVATPQPPTSSPFETSIAGVSDPGQRGASDDPDGDGRSNLFEHATGTSCANRDPGYQVTAMPSPDTLSLVLPGAAPEDVVYRLEFATEITNGAGWTVRSERTGSGPWVGDQPVESGPDSNGRMTYTFATPGGNRGFLRLRMELAP